MKQILFILLISLFLPAMSIGQVPQKFNYQAAVRNTDGSIMANQDVVLEIILRKATTTGVNVYQENHTLKTSAQGIIAVEIGGGTNQVGNFSIIPWSEGIFIELKIKKAGATEYTLLGVSQILSVPYALNAGNAIQGDAVKGQTVVHNGNTWVASDRMSVSQNTVAILPEKGRDEEQPLFSVRNSDDKIVFAVYESGVKVYVDDTDTKGNRGGFVVGGFSDQTKEDKVDYLTIFPDQVEFNIQQAPGGKGNRGGFVVGGFSDQTKGVTQNYFTLKSDSAKFTLTDNKTKGNRGGFVVGGFSDQTKGYTDYLTVNSDSTSIYTNLNTAGNVNIQGDLLTGGDIGSLPITIDGTSYKTIKIGKQVWMKENLKTRTYNNNTEIPSKDYTFNPTDEIPGGYEAVYGLLYNQDAVASGNLCPTGWHVPKPIDWEELFISVEGSNWEEADNKTRLAGKLMDAESGLWPEWGDVTPDNASGFSAIPGGFAWYNLQDEKNDFSAFKESANYWKTQGDYIQIDTSVGIESFSSAGGIYFYSVRCVKDK